MGQSSEMPCGDWLPSLPQRRALVEDRLEGAGRAANPSCATSSITCANRLGARLLSPSTRLPKLLPPKPSLNVRAPHLSWVDSAPQTPP